MSHKTKAPKVWYISRFRQRYELPDDVRLDRKSPLIYTKDFVGGGSDDESCGHWRQMMALRSRRNWLALRGAFAELKNVAGNMSSEYRGYLLGSNFEPASVKEIGRWLGVGEKKAESIINELRDVGLLERVTCPLFNGSPEAPGRARRRPGASGKRRKSLKKKAKAKVKVNGNGKGKSKKNKKRLRDKDNANVTKVPPPTTQPIKPHVSAERGSVIQFTAPSELKNTGRLGDITKKILHGYNPDAKQFAFEIYQALKLPWNPTSDEGKRELGCFASVWEKAVGWQNKGIPMEVIDELRARSIDEARKIARRRQNRKKGAVWCVVFKNLLAARCKRVEAV